MFGEFVLVTSEGSFRVSVAGIYKMTAKGQNDPHQRHISQLPRRPVDTPCFPPSHMAWKPHVQCGKVHIPKENGGKVIWNLKSVKKARSLPVAKKEETWIANTRSWIGQGWNSCYKNDGLWLDQWHGSSGGHNRTHFVV